LKVWFTKGNQVPTVGTGQQEGVRVLQQEDNMLHIAYQGPADRVLKWLAKFPVDRIATPQTSLEEAFIQYYRKEDTHEA